MVVRKWSLAWCLLGAAACNVAQLALAKDELTIGSTAPAIDVEHWIQNGRGAFKPVTKFEKGKVYVIEFWATTCPPCRASMPHLSLLQKKYATDGVQIVSISDEGLDEIKEFLQSPFSAASGSEPVTFDRVTQDYCLTTDPDQSVMKDYMDAANQKGIPCAFVVGKDQKIEWIGHPMKLDPVLDQVVHGKWNRQGYAEAFAESQKALETLDLAMNRVYRKDTAGGLKMMDDFLVKAKRCEGASQLANMRMQVLLDTNGPAEKLTQALQDAARLATDDLDDQFVLAYYATEVHRKCGRIDGALLKQLLATLDQKTADDDPQKEMTREFMLARLSIASGDKAKGMALFDQLKKKGPPEAASEIDAYLKEVLK